MLTNTTRNDYPSSLNRLAVVGLVLGAAVAMAGLFALPALESLGLAFREAFVVIGVVEFVSAVVVGTAAYHLYTVRGE